MIGEKEYRGRGIGRSVIQALIERGRKIGYKELNVKEIYAYNEGSKKLFTSLGFREKSKTADGHSKSVGFNCYLCSHSCIGKFTKGFEHGIPSGNNKIETREYSAD